MTTSEVEIEMEDQPVSNPASDAFVLSERPRSRSQLTAVDRRQGDEVDAYERLLTDAMRRDSLLFVRKHAVEVSSSVVQQLLGNVAPAYEYESGSCAPTEAVSLTIDVGGWLDPQ